MELLPPLHVVFDLHPIEKGVPATTSTGIWNAVLTRMSGPPGPDRPDSREPELRHRGQNA